MPGRFRFFPQAAEKTSNPAHVPAGPAEPSYLVGLAVNAWVEIAGSSPSANPPAVNPGPGPIANIIDVWNGLAFDRRYDKAWGARPGGHTDQYYQGVFNWDLQLNSPVMVETMSSNTFAEITPGNVARDPVLLKPQSSHKYFTSHIIRARNWLVDFGVGSVANSGNPLPQCEAYDITQTGNAWQAVGTVPDLPVVNNAQYVCKDELLEDVYIMNDNSAVYKWTQSTNTFTGALGSFPPVSGIDALGAFDTTRGHMLVLKGVSSASHTFNPTTLTWTARTLTGAAATPLMALAKGCGIEYVEAIDAYLVRGGAAGGTVYRIDAGTWEVTTLATTGGASVPAAALISGAPENIYSRWRLSTNYRCMFLLPSYAANWWALRVY